MVAAGTMPAPPSRRRDGRRAGHQPQEPVGAHEAAGDRLSCRPGAAGLDHIGMMAVLGRMAVARSGAGGDARSRRIDRASFVRRASAVMSWPCPEARWTRESSVPMLEGRQCGRLEPPIERDALHGAGPLLRRAGRGRPPARPWRHRTPCAPAPARRGSASSERGASHCRTVPGLRGLGEAIWYCLGRPRAFGGHLVGTEGFARRPESVDATALAESAHDRVPPDVPPPTART